MATFTIGDFWDAADDAGVRPYGAAAGRALIPGLRMIVPNRGFADHRVASTSLLQNARGLGLQVQASGKYPTPAPRENVWVVPAELLMADTADPGTVSITGAKAVSGYIGGWTPHVWLLSQWQAQTVPLHLSWVYNPNRPGATSGTSDANAAVAKCRSLGVPPGVKISIDMEASADQAYCQAFRAAASAAGYWVAIYGSAAHVFANWPTPNGPGGGWGVAQWTGIPHLYSDGVHGNIAYTQYADARMSGTPYDWSVARDLARLWDLAPQTQTVTVTATAPEGSAQWAGSFTVG